ncbi:MAG TPA: 3-oxoacyl-ACP reductase family protein [Cytophagales bacterium]|nr:3-oxoacyl-ACP reductase family protein [Cytophagales bacterium]
MKNLEGKVVFITGGSRGMGAAIAKRLASEGASIAFTHTGKSQEKADAVLDALHSKGVKALALITDYRKSEALISALKAAEEKLGKIDILVNNAGVYSQSEITDITPDEYDQVMNVNVKDVFIASQYVANQMKSGGRIITIGSNMGDRVSFSGGSLYAMSKSALIGLTKGMARDLGARNITVNLIQPGPVDTDMNPATAPHAPTLINALAIKRYGTVEEIAGLVSYLSGNESQFITGTAITIDGGFNI